MHICIPTLKQTLRYGTLTLDQGLKYFHLKLDLSNLDELVCIGVRGIRTLILMKV